MMGEALCVCDRRENRRQKAFAIYPKAKRDTTASPNQLRTFLCPRFGGEFDAPVPAPVPAPLPLPWTLASMESRGSQTKQVWPCRWCGIGVDDTVSAAAAAAVPLAVPPLPPPIARIPARPGGEGEEDTEEERVTVG